MSKEVEYNMNLFEKKVDSLKKTESEQNWKDTAEKIELDIKTKILDDAIEKFCATYLRTLLSEFVEAKKKLDVNPLKIQLVEFDDKKNQIKPIDSELSVYSCGSYTTAQKHDHLFNVEMYVAENFLIYRNVEENHIYENDIVLKKRRPNPRLFKDVNQLIGLKSYCVEILKELDRVHPQYYDYWNNYDKLLTFDRSIIMETLIKQFTELLLTYIPAINTIEYSPITISNPTQKVKKKWWKL